MPAVYGNPEQRKSNTSLSINVYPSRSGWRATVLVREHGRPYPRVVDDLMALELGPEAHNLSSALEAAAAVLLRQAREHEA